MFQLIVTLLLATGHADTKASMDKMLQDLTGLKKYMVSDFSFEDPKNTEAIAALLSDFSKSVKKTRHDPVLIKDNFKFSRDVLQEHVQETERIFRLGNKPFARWMLNSTVNLCMNCHTQMPTTTPAFSPFLNSKFFESEFDQAEFQFATKNFEDANKIYRKIIDGFPSSNSDIMKLTSSVERLLTYYLRLQRDIGGAQKFVAQLAERKNLPLALQQNLKAWNEQLKKWETRKIPDLGKTKIKDFIKFVASNLSIESNKTETLASDSRLISNLIVSGALYEYLQKHSGSSVTPDLFYWLAVVDKEIRGTFPYSLADLYLKECMLKHPAHPTAMKCYDEYEAIMMFGYTGSSGTHLPEDVAQELKALKSYIKAKGKVPLRKAL